MSARVTLLLILLFLKHFWADFVWQDGKMAKEKASNLKVLFLHAFHHAGLTFAVLFALGYSLSRILEVFAAELFLHSFFDFLKARNIFYKKADYPQRWYFINLGFDQFLHALTYIAIVYFLSL